MDDDELGGDAACWAHKFGEVSETRAVDLAELAGMEDSRVLRWALQGEDLNLNLLTFDAGDGVAEHVNHEVEVLLVGIEGEGMAIVDGHEHPLAAGRIVLVPKGARRATRATTDGFAYLTCHRKRGGLMPAVPQRGS